MSAENGRTGWRRWREGVFAACTAWLVLQNLVILAIVASGDPAGTLAAGAALARTALSWSGQLLLLALASALGLALAAWLVHAPAAETFDTAREVPHDV